MCLMANPEKSKEIKGNPKTSHTTLRQKVGYVVDFQRVKMDEEEVKVIQSWLTPKSIGDVEFLEQFLYVIKHKQGKTNVVADALFRRHSLLAKLETKLLGFEYIKELYIEDGYFKETYELCANVANEGFNRIDGFLFKDKRLCVPKSSIRELLMKEAHESGLMGQFEEYKTYKTFQEYFFWSHMKRDVHHIYNKCLFCKQAKAKVHSHIEKKVKQYANRANKGNYKPNLRANSFQEREPDEILTSLEEEPQTQKEDKEIIDIQALQRPMIGGRLKRLRRHCNRMAQTSSSLAFEIRPKTHKVRSSSSLCLIVLDSTIHGHCNTSFNCL
ncbi:hypothetical protein CR513_06648, partial [Mucuna pruriens]